MNNIALLISFLFLGSGVRAGNDLSARIRCQLNSSATEPGLYYPASVPRFYSQNSFQPAWIKAQAAGQALHGRLCY